MAEPFVHAVQPTFTRESLAAYEKPVAAPPPAEKDLSATPASEDVPVPDADPSTADDTVQPVVADDDSSADITADPAAAPADSEGVTDPVVEPPVVKPRPAKGSAAERIQGLVSKGHEQDVTIETLKQLNVELLAALREGKPTAKAADAPVVSAALTADTAEDPQPTIDQFEYDPTKHGKALNEWFEKRLAKAAAKIEANVTQTVDERSVVAAARAKFNERATEYAKTNPDFDKLVKAGKLPPLAERSARTIVLSPNGPAIQHELLKDPVEAKRIAALDPADQLVAIGEISGRVAAKAAVTPPPKPKPQQKTVTGAPPPPTPNPSGSPTNIKNVLDGSMSMDDWVANERATKIAAREQQKKMRQRASR